MGDVFARIKSCAAGNPEVELFKYHLYNGETESRCWNEGRDINMTTSSSELSKRRHSNNVHAVISIEYAACGPPSIGHVGTESIFSGDRQCIDSNVHSRNLTMAIGFGTTVHLFVLLMFAMTDMDAVIGAGLPSIELMYQVTGSKPVATFLTCWVLLIYISKWWVVSLLC